MTFLLALTNPGPRDQEFARNWVKQTRQAFNGYISLLLGEEPSELTAEEQKLMDFYEGVVKTAKVTASVDKDGKIVASGVIDALKGKPKIKND